MKTITWLRCLLVWLAVTALTGALCRGLFGGVRAPLPQGFDLLLARLAEWAVLGCLAWLWVVTTAVVVEAATLTRRTRGLIGTPAVLRRAVLCACGAAVAAGLTAPAMAEDIHLPTALAVHLAERLDALAPPAHTRTQGRETHVVRRGDTLWAIAAGRLDARASPAEVTAEWRRIYAANQNLIGPDPDVIQPGQRLALPEEVRDE